MNLLRDALIFVPSRSVPARASPISSSSLVTAAIVLGLIQFVACALLLLQRYKHFMTVRTLVGNTVERAA